MPDTPSPQPAEGPPERSEAPKKDWRDTPQIHANWKAERALFGDHALDPMHLRVVSTDGKPVVLGRCPGCGSWCELDNDQLDGIVSTHHDVPECGYHETKNWREDHIA